MFRIFEFNILVSVDAHGGCPTLRGDIQSGLYCAERVTQLPPPRIMCHVIPPLHTPHQ